MTAHYYATKSRKFVIISSDLGRTVVAKFDVTGKRHAARIAAEYNARPWNF